MSPALPSAGRVSIQQRGFPSFSLASPTDRALRPASRSNARAPVKDPWSEREGPSPHPCASDMSTQGCPTCRHQERRGGLEEWRLGREREYAVYPFWTKLIRVFYHRAHPACMQDLNSPPKTFWHWEVQNVHGKGNNQSINQSITHSINQSGPDRVSAPLQRDSARPCHGCPRLSHVSPTPPQHMEDMGDGGPHTILHTWIPASMVSRDLLRPANHQSVVLQIYRKRSLSGFNPPSPRSQDSVRIHIYYSRLTWALA
jgi:hypothetical protein